MAKLAARFGNFVQWFKRPSSASLSASIKKSPALVAAPVSDGGLLVDDYEAGDSLPAKKPAKESPVEKLQRGYEEMITMMGSVRSHMEQQSHRSERLLNILEGLPEALKSLPEATRNQTRTLEAIQANLSQQGQHNTRLAEALTGLSKSTQRHEQAMGAIGQQLDASQARSEQILGSFNTLTGTLGRMSDANEASTGLLRRMAEQESQAAEQVRQLFVRNQKQMTTMSVVSWSLALVALTVAGYVAVSVSKLAGPGTLAAAPTVAPVVTPAPVITPASVTPTPVVLPSVTPVDIAPAPAPVDAAPAATDAVPLIPAIVEPVTPALPDLPPATDTPAAEKPGTEAAKTGLADEAKETPVDDGASAKADKLVEEEGK